jgi:hypothetical protein
MTETHSLGDAEVKLYKLFPYESLCCNGDYCEANCGEKTRKEILDLINALLLGQKEGFRREIEKVIFEINAKQIGSNEYQAGKIEVCNDLLTKLDNNLV